MHITTEEVVVEDDVDHYRDSAGMYIREPVSLPRVRYVDCGAFPTFYITLYDFIFRYIEKIFYIWILYCHIRPYLLLISPLIPHHCKLVPRQSFLPTEREKDERRQREEDPPLRLLSRSQTFIVGRRSILLFKPSPHSDTRANIPQRKTGSNISISAQHPPAATDR